MTTSQTVTHIWVTVIQIDVYPVEENLIHKTHTLHALVHVHHMHASCGQSLYVTTFHADATELVEWTAPEKKCSRLHLPARLSGPRDPPQFLSQHNHWSSALKLRICWWTCYIGLLGSYLCHVISTLSLTGTGGGYNLGGAGFPQRTSRPSQPMVHRFPPKGPARSQVNKPTNNSNRTKVVKPYISRVGSTTWLLP
jgi:hypothetical protein